MIGTIVSDTHTFAWFACAITGFIRTSNFRMPYVQLEKHNRKSGRFVKLSSDMKTHAVLVP